MKKSFGGDSGGAKKSKCLFSYAIALLILALLRPHCLASEATNMFGLYTQKISAPVPALAPVLGGSGPGPGMQTGKSQSWSRSRKQFTQPRGALLSNVGLCVTWTEMHKNKVTQFSLILWFT